MKPYIFDIAVEEDRFEDGKGAFHAWCPALKGCNTWGHTYEEALANVREAIELYIEDMIEAYEPLPAGPSKGVIERDSLSVVVNVP